MGQFFKMFPNLSQNWLKFNILEKSDDFAQNLAQNWADWYMNGSLFLQKLVFVWVYFQILRWHIPTKTKLEYPPGQISAFKPKIWKVFNSQDPFFTSPNTLEIRTAHPYLKKTNKQKQNECPHLFFFFSRLNFPILTHFRSSVDLQVKEGKLKFKIL